MPRRHFIGLTMVILCGCGGNPYKLAQVSGKVTLDGKPLVKASVNFLPMSTPGAPNPGPTAYGETDAEGRFTIKVDPQTPGAVVGPCRVYITTLLSDPANDDRDAGGAKKVKDKVPAKYNKETTLVFTVPPGGTDQADFPLESR